MQANFNQTLVALQDDLWRYAFKLTADHEAANDLVQETSLRALDNASKFVPDTNFKGWVYTIMRNIFINDYRRNERMSTFIDQSENLYFINAWNDKPRCTTDEQYDLNEMKRVVHQLPREYRQPFAMFVSGFKYREIADMLHLPLGTVKSRIFTTRSKLQHELAEFLD